MEGMAANMAQIESDVLLTVEEVAQRLRYRPATIQGWLRQGKLRGRKVGKEWRVSQADLEMWLAQGAEHRP